MSNFIPVTRTKIILPRRRSELLSRQRLLDLLDELLENRLIIVAAPAGYGKTSLLVDFAYITPWPVCWYSLDSLDQDPLRFIAHFISAIRLRFPNFGKSCMAALESMGEDRLDLDVLISLIINDAYENITEHFILVLDDFHLVESSRSVIYFINRFIQDIDENCHLILASRALLTLPDLPLMVARAQVGGLSFEELSFTPEEIQVLLRQNYQLSLTDAEAADLARDTEGWVTGLLMSTQLMGKTIANRKRVERVSGVGLYEYLVQQVLAQQSEELQLFLMRSSLLEEFDDRLCEEVIGRALGVQGAQWRDLMDMVMRHNLFVLPVGEDGLYLRYHHLFQEFLRDRIRRERPEEARLIQLQLASFYIEREDWERAYLIYQGLGETEAIVRMVEKAGSAMISHGRRLTLKEWLESMSQDLLNRYPSLISLQGVVTVNMGDSSLGLQLLDRAITLLRDAGDPLALALSLVRRSTAKRLLGQYQEALQDVQEALSLVSEEGPTCVVYADALQSKAVILYLLGQANEAVALLQQALEVYLVSGDDNTVAQVWMEIGRIARTMGQYAESEEAFQKALEYYQRTGNLLGQANLHNSLGVLQHARNDFVTATTSFERAIHYARVGGSPRLEAYAMTSIGDLYQELEAVQETLEAYRRAREITQRTREGYLLFYLHLAESRLRLSQGEIGTAQELLQAAQTMAEQRGSLFEQNVCRLEWGRVRLARQQVSEAWNDLNAALGFFIQGGYQVEVPRARLYVAIAAVQAGELEQAEQQVRQLQSLLAYEDQRKLLVAAGRELKPQLEALQEDPILGDLARALLEEVERYRQGIPALRRVIRRHAVVVPFAPPKMIIRSLGKIQVRVSDRIVTSSDWQVQTARDLFFLLLAHPEGLTKEQIGEIFWPDSSPSELKLRFKNTIYRLRHGAGKDAILFQGDSLYLFNRDMDYEYDVELFLKEISLGEKAESPEKQEVHFLNAVKLYRGPYLPELDDDWVVVERERLYQLYMDALLRLALLKLEARQFEAALEFCHRALKEDNCQEDAHRIAMRVHAAMGNRALVIRQYEQCRQALEEEVNAPPSLQTRKLYETLIR